MWVCVRRNSFLEIKKEKKILEHLFSRRASPRQNWWLGRAEKQCSADLLQEIKFFLALMCSSQRWRLTAECIPLIHDTCISARMYMNRRWIAWCVCCHGVNVNSVAASDGCSHVIGRSSAVLISIYVFVQMHMHVYLIWEEKVYMSPVKNANVQFSLT